MKTKTVLAAALVGALAFTATIAHTADAHPWWNDGMAKQSNADFVAKVT